MNDRISDVLKLPVEWGRETTNKQIYELKSGRQTALNNPMFSVGVIRGFRGNSYNHLPPTE